MRISLRLASCTVAVGAIAFTAGCGAAPTPSAHRTVSESPKASSGPSLFKTSVSPSSNVTPSTVVTARSTGAAKNTAYYCLEAAFSTTGGSVSAADNATLKVVRSDPAGDITCQIKYQPFSARDSRGVIRHCPTTAPDAMAGFHCGVALADAATFGHTSASVAPFATSK